MTVQDSRDGKEIREPAPRSAPIQSPRVVPRWEIQAIARRLRQASATMGVHVTDTFAERMATEGLRRSGEVGMAKASDTVIFFVEPADGATATILGWADDRSCLDRFASLRLASNPTHRVPVDVAVADDAVPEL